MPEIEQHPARPAAGQLVPGVPPPWVQACSVDVRSEELTCCCEHVVEAPLPFVHE
jgi:hypothetical protein